MSKTNKISYILNKISDLLNLNKISNIGYKISVFVYKIFYLSNKISTLADIVDILFVNVIKIYVEEDILFDK